MRAKLPSRVAALRPSWDAALFLAFIPGAAWAIAVTIYKPETVGSQGVLYAQAAAAWLTGGDPWTVGVPNGIFAGPPTMLFPFVPLAFVPVDVLRVAFVVVDMLVAVWVLRRLQLPTYWLIFPPLIQAISVGHPEVLVLGLLVHRGPSGAIAMLIKPYTVVAFIAERRWAAIAIAAATVLLTLPLLPWRLFFEESAKIAMLLDTQTSGDSVFGQPVLMVIAVLALATLGLRRGLWLAVPVLWPFTQPMYKVMTVPMLSPVVALFWAFPFAGFTLLGLVAEAVLHLIDRRWPLPAWLKAGIAVKAASLDEPKAEPAPRLQLEPAAP